VSAPFGIALDRVNPTVLETYFYETHAHGRNDPLSEVVAAHMAKRCDGAILEPNTNPRLLKAVDVENYLRIFHGLQPSVKWVGTIYLTLDTDLDEVLKVWRLGLIAGVKWYPPGHQQAGDRSVTPEMFIEPNSPIAPLLRMMEREGIPLMLHGEVKVWRGIDIHPEDQEALFIKVILPKLRVIFSKLRISLEHISTKEAAEYMAAHGEPYYLVCTITAHHLALDSRYLYLNGFLRPDHHCLPIIKKLEHLLALHALIRLRLAFVMAGTDLAPHDIGNKHAYCCWGGVYTGHCSVELYAQVLEFLDALDYLDTFLYWNAKRFHRKLVPVNPRKIRLVRERWKQTEPFTYGEGKAFTPFGYFPNPNDQWQFTWKLAA